jgi:lipopolysaccharide export system protein LptA
MVIFNVPLIANLTGFPALRACSAAVLALAMGASLAQAQAPAATPASAAANSQKQSQKAAVKAQQSGPFGNFGGNSKDPIKIDADRLDVQDKEGKAIYAGNVVAVQGETTVRCTIMTIFYQSRQRNEGQPKTQAAANAPRPAPTPAPAATPAADGKDSSIKQVDCTGPVTVVSKTQTASANHALFDRAANKVTLTGNVAVADGPNITRGEKLIYDTQTGIANVETKPGGRVQGFFIPGSETSTPDAQAAKPKPAKPRTPAQATN